MADNEISSLFAMNGDQMSLEDIVLSINSPTDGANCMGSKYSGKPALLSSKLRFCPITCMHNSSELPGGVWPENPSDDQVRTYTQGIDREKGEC